ncbi:membrane protein [Catellatospora sp. TT07R-123]|uniref:peptidase C39 family protein n=1 Tax=Catellatospora sp. TT07R-123 TaxID=2733863 RepID=UPI001B0E2E46|nr:peptidase C39 family protein [Catellatospora sp. TT07R-123]GHJ47943.1 membrane protein [Catellatospora sp. TT07R-123]
MDRRTVLRTAVAAGAAAGLALGEEAMAAGKPQPVVRDIRLHRWSGTAGFAAGTGTGTTVSGGALVVDTPAGQLSYLDPHTGVSADYDYAAWTSPWAAPGFAATEAIPSWNATTPAGTWVQVDLRGTTEAGTTTRWYVLGRWADGDTGVRRTSVGGQADADGAVTTDTFTAAAGRGWTSWQLRITLLRPIGSTLSPAVRSVAAVASRLPAPGKLTASTPTQAQGTVLAVPQYSQNVHDGHYPEYNGGGEAWCSPTSTSMVLACWGVLPPAADYAWVDGADPAPWVDHAARQTFDQAYDGTGNWPFNTAYAATRGLDGFVTRLRGLTEAEAFIAAGIPLVLSVSYKKGEVPGLDYATSGHLLVLAGFSATGDPVLNDPHAPTDAGVRKTAGRAAFEAAWLNSSRGVVYVMRPATVALPPAPVQANW